MIPTDEQGQTETLGYVLIFSVIIISIGAIYTSGITDLGDQRESVAFDNTERAMKIYAANIEDIYEHGAPSRATEFKLYDNALAIDGETKLRIDIVNASSGTTESTYGTFTSQPLFFESEKGSIAYELGAVVRNRDGSRAVVQRAPPFSFSDDATVLTHVQSEGSESIASASDTVLVVADAQGTRLRENLADDGTAYNVTVRIETSPERARAWRDYLESEGLNDTGNTDLSTGTVEYVYNETDQVFLRQTVLQVTIEE